jgi:hypothetical protein
MDLGGGFTDYASAGYWEEDAFAAGPNSTQSALDLLWISSYGDDTAAFPTGTRQVTITPGGFLQCNDCVYFGIGCDPMTGQSCTEEYLAQTGTLNVTQDTFIPDAGTFAGTASNLHMVQWHIPQSQGDMDQAVNNPKCIDITSVTFNATWP